MVEPQNSFIFELGGWLVLAVGAVFVSAATNLAIKGELFFALLNLIPGLLIGVFGVWLKRNPNGLRKSIHLPLSKAASVPPVWIALVIIGGLYFYQINRPPASGPGALFSAGGDAALIGNDLPGLKFDRPIVSAGGKLTFNNNSTREYADFPSATGEFSRLTDLQLKDELSKLEAEVQKFNLEKHSADEIFNTYQDRFAKRALSLAAEVVERTGTEPWNDPNAPEDFRGGKRIVLSGRATGFSPMKHVVYFLIVLERNFQKFVRVPR